MLERIYIDNYKCLVNFEYRPGALQLLLGRNGSGKSTVFEALGLLRSLIVEPGASTIQLFNPRTLTRWEQRDVQRFELEVTGNGGRYVYKLAIQHQTNGSRPDPPRNRVLSEALTFDGRYLFQSGMDEEKLFRAHLFRDDFTEGPEVLLDWERSGIAMLMERPYNTKLTWFKNWIGRLCCIQIDPHLMSPASTGDQIYPANNLSNYASWYRHLHQEQPRVTERTNQYVREIIDGFDTLVLSKEGETTRLLKVAVRNGREMPPPYNFDELSEGERAIFGLYTLLALLKETQFTLCIDEPDNFVALPEIQPWLMELQDLTAKEESQALVISHHPEMLNYLVPRGAAWFSREAEAPTRVAPFIPSSDEPLSAAEIVRRGWEESTGSG